MRIEGEKGVKTQSAPKHWPRTRKRNFGRAIPTGRPLRSSREGIARARPDYLLRDRNRSRGTHEPGKNRPRSADFVSERTDRAVDPGNKARPRPKSLVQTIWPTKSLDRDKIHRPSAQNFSRPRYTMAKTKGNESMKKKKNPFMQPPKKQIKLGSSSSNARAEIPTSPHSIDASKEHVESPRGGEDDRALVTFVGEQNQDPRKCKKAMEKVNIEPCVKMDTQTLDLFKIRDDVTWYIRRLGLSKLFKLECSEYSQLTKEFLSTVALPFPTTMETNQLNHHPAIRYVHRLISTTFQCKQEANKVTTDEFYILTTPFIKHEYKANLGLLLAKTFINVRKLAKDLEGNKKLCVRFGRLITAIVLHVGIDIPNYEPLPKPTPLDLHALQHIHFLNRWTKDPTRFCYEFPIGPANTSLVLLPHEDIPSLRSGVVTFQPNEEEFYVPSSEKPSFPMLTYRTLQHAVKTQRRLQERHVLTTGMAAHQALDRVNKLEKIVECQSRFISRLVRVVRHIAPERLFRPSSTAREPYEPDLGEFSLDSELGSEGDDPIDEEESSSHCHT
ncbi:unnamed protein product [Microthlaspi erraticum]|uniref:Arabidopsis retrotransposon Orf1 C-terminal domain-containing protein n=1 Tax=Microthlaspi erraticum TaxID=1685480 RepID=A0A6D2JMV6_9BRAS|nr:unnamed protein product [Microthlaspi erraticum]